MKIPVAAALALCCAAPAAAHPHVWVEAAAEFRANQGTLRDIRHTWRFDEMFSDFLIGEFDADGDLSFSIDETVRIQDEAFSLLHEYDYFIDLRQGAGRMPMKVATDLSVEIDREARLVTYRFTTPLPEAVSLSGGAVSLALYDDTFYIDIGLAETDPVRFSGITGCSYDIQENPDIDLMGGLFHPKAIWIECAAS